MRVIIVGKPRSTGGGACHYAASPTGVPAAYETCTIKSPRALPVDVRCHRAEVVTRLKAAAETDIHEELVLARIRRFMQVLRQRPDGRGAFAYAPGRVDAEFGNCGCLCARPNRSLPLCVSSMRSSTRHGRRWRGYPRGNRYCRGHNHAPQASHPGRRRHRKSRMWLPATSGCPRYRMLRYRISSYMASWHNRSTDTDSTRKLVGVACRRNRPGVHRPCSEVGGAGQYPYPAGDIGIPLHTRVGRGLLRQNADSRPAGHGYLRQRNGQGSDKDSFQRFISKCRSSPACRNLSR